MFDIAVTAASSSTPPSCRASWHPGGRVVARAPRRHAASAGVARRTAGRQRRACAVAAAIGRRRRAPASAPCSRRPTASPRRGHAAGTAEHRHRPAGRVLLHPVAGMRSCWRAVPDVPAVFSWAQIPMDGIKAGFELLGSGVSAVLRRAAAQLHPGRPDQRRRQRAGVLPQILVLSCSSCCWKISATWRGAFLMDRIMGGAGLHGRAFIPLLSSFACAIPGIMSARVIDSRATGSPPSWWRR